MLAPSRVRARLRLLLPVGPDPAIIGKASYRIGQRAASPYVGFRCTQVTNTVPVREGWLG